MSFRADRADIIRRLHWLHHLQASTEHACEEAGEGRVHLTPFCAAVARGQTKVARYLFRWGFDTHTGYYDQRAERQVCCLPRHIDHDTNLHID